MAHTWISNLLSDDDLKKIENSIQSVEKQTMAEIVVCVVRQSVPIGTFYAMLNAFLAMIIIAIYFSVPQLHTPWFLVASILVSYVLSKALSTQAWAIRLLMPKADRDALTLQRAMLEFYSSEIKKTDKSTGILIFLSVAEHAIHILADKAVADKFPATHWGDAVQRIISGIKQNKLKDSLLETLSAMAPDLKNYFPALDENRNELPDHVIIKDT